MYLPTPEQFRKDQRIPKQWGFLRKEAGADERPVILWLLLPLAFAVIVCCVWPIGPNGLDAVWYLDALFIVGGIALTVPSIVCALKWARRPTALRFAGSCFSCGAARIEGTDACNHCGADFAEQDVHHNAMLHDSNRYQHLTLVDRMHLRHGVKTFAPLLLGMAVALPVMRRISGSAREYPYLCLSLGAGIIVFAVCGGFLLISRSEKRYRAALAALHESCLVCGANHPPEHERLEWCPTCGASYVWQRASREAYTDSRVARGRLTQKGNMRLSADQPRRRRGK
jgi:hypothetical protein